MKINPTSFALPLIAGALLVSGAPSHGLIISDDVDFSVVYQASVMPNQSVPVWSQASAAGTASVSSGVLTFNTPLAGDRVYRIQSSTGNWDGATETGSTIEFSLRVESTVDNARAATALYFSTGSRGYLFQFDVDGVLYGSTKVAFDTSSDFQRYRITLSPEGMANLYTNGNPEPLISNFSGSSVTTNHIYFGDPGSGAGGIAHWEYVAYTNAASVSPIPEGGTISMALLGGTLLLGGRHWFRTTRKAKP